MIKKYYLKIGTLLIAFLMTNASYAQQDLKSVLNEMLHNNQQLKVAAKECERLKIESTIGLLPADPEVEYGYLWGSPATMGNRKDFSVTQNLDFPTVYTSKNKFSRIQQSMADKLFQKNKQEVVSTALNLMIELIYHQKLLSVLEARFADVQKISEMTRRMLEAGEIGLLEKDKADLQLLNIQNEVEVCKTDMQKLRIRLKALNGNKALRINSKFYPEFLSLADESTTRSLFLQQNADFLIMKEEVDLHKQQIIVSNNEYLPNFSVAYATEIILDEKLKGIKAGISIPLWHKRNTVKLSKIAFSEKEDQMLEFNQTKEAEWDQLWTQYKSQKDRFLTMKNLLDRIVPNKSLMMAFDLGEISLMEFITESAFYYDGQDSYLQLEKDMYLNIAEIKKVELAL